MQQNLQKDKKNQGSQPGSQPSQSQVAALVADQLAGWLALAGCFAGCLNNFCLLGSFVALPGSIFCLFSLQITAFIAFLAFLETPPPAQPGGRGKPASHLVPQGLAGLWEGASKKAKKAIKAVMHNEKRRKNEPGNATKLPKRQKELRQPARQPT